MLHKLIKKSSVLVLIISIFMGSVDPFAVFTVFNNGFKVYKKSNIVDKLYIAQQDSNVVDTSFQKAYAAVNSSQKEYSIDIGPVNGSTAANYVYTSFFNPSGSGRTASIKRIAIRSNTASSTASNYVNLTVRRITSASAGTQILAANFPQKNASSSNSIIEIRHTGVTAGFAGTVVS